ncbi:MAG TPA: hypothetical protein VJ850_08050 [Candidatus Limnocylindrales bacterium]|nr:hypothetical protein [Candidatus Limnocylindrales bacterium]
MSLPDRDVEARFERRFAGIESQVPPTPRFEMAPRRPAASMRRSIVTAVAAIVVVLLGVPMLGLLPSSQNPSATSAATFEPSTSTSADATQLPSRTPAAFPAQVAGLPVDTVKHAVELLEAGELDGREIAVAGYYAAFYPSCPYPGRYIGPLERWCSETAFADTPDGARLCVQSGDGTACHGPGGTYLSPFGMPETSGDLSPLGNGFDPVALVLIGHAGDARQWQCTAAKQDECAHAFVVDRVAWADGRDVPLAAPQTGFLDTGAIIMPARTLEEAAAAAGITDELITGAAFRAADVASVDPRWSLAGSNIVWLIRTMASSEFAAGFARPGTVWLVGDTDGNRIDFHPLGLDPSFQPGRIWLSATVNGYECCPGSLAVLLHVEDAGGMTVFDGRLLGGAQGTGTGPDASTTFGGGYGSTPLVLPAGEYTVTLSVAADTRSQRGPTACSMRLPIRTLDSVGWSAVFPVDGPCAFSQLAAPTPGP